MKKRAFRIFLVFYLVVIIVHLVEVFEVSLPAVLFLITGLLASVIAHRQRANFFGFALISGHLIIESYHHSQHSWHYDSLTIVWCLIHLTMDIIFLWSEGKNNWVTIGILGLSAGIFIVFLEEAPNTSPVLLAITAGHSHPPSLIESLTLGAIFGCAISHFCSFGRRPKEPFYLNSGQIWVKESKTFGKASLAVI